MKRIILSLTMGVLLFACGETVTPYEIDKPILETKYDKTYQFNLTQSNVRKSTEGFAWSSSDESVGTISASGLFKAKKVGKTTITATQGKAKIKSEVTVTPYSNMFIEPYFGFGSTPATIKSKDSRKLIHENSDGILLESGSSKATAILYLFNGSKMYACGAQVVLTTPNITELATFVKERYTREEFKDSEYVWFTDGKTLRIAIILDESIGLVVYYMTKETRDSYYSTIKSDIKVSRAFSTDILGEINRLTKP